MILHPKRFHTVHTQIHTPMAESTRQGDSQLVRTIEGEVSCSGPPRHSRTGRAFRLQKSPLYLLSQFNPKTSTIPTPTFPVTRCRGTMRSEEEAERSYWAGGSCCDDSAAGWALVQTQRSERRRATHCASEGAGGS